MAQEAEGKQAGCYAIKCSKTLSLFFIVQLLFLLWLTSCISLHGQSRVELTNVETGKKLLNVILEDGEPVVLYWRNSLFDLDVAERFVVEGGVLVLTEVTFANPKGGPLKIVQLQDVEDLYQTGGPFSAKGLRKPFTQVTFRIGEIGHPKMQIMGRLVDLKQAVGFGGRVCLTVRKVNLYESVLK